jgi:predicted DCC family thiol-disulfide oxidoreductase YuxK
VAEGADEKDKEGEQGADARDSVVPLKEGAPDEPTGPEKAAEVPRAAPESDPDDPYMAGIPKWRLAIYVVLHAIILGGAALLGAFFALDINAPKLGPWATAYQRPLAIAAGALMVVTVLSFWRLVLWPFLRLRWVILTKEGRAWARENYLSIDPRTVGVFRIVHGFLLATDCLRHWNEARWFYSNEGVLSNHYHLYRPSSGYNFSIYHAFGSLPEVHVAFALSTLVYFLYMIGWHARIFSVLSFFLVTSMDNRLVMVENGGYVVVNLITCYAMFLPTDRRFSVDAWLRSLRERKEASVSDINERYRPPREIERYVSGIVLLAVLNLAVVYFFNVINKSGRIWRSGDTVHYVLHLDRMVTGIAVFFREHLPYPVTRLVTWGVLSLEGVLIPLILSPYARRVTRPLALIGIWILHGTFGIMMRLGPFSWFLMGWSLLLIAPENWDSLERWYRRRAAPRVVIYDRSSPLAFALARRLARLDGLDLLRFEESQGESPELLAARDPDSGKLFTGSEALSEILRALPGGKYFGPIIMVLTLGLMGTIFRFISARRARVARFFGLTIPPAGREESSEPTPLGQKIGRARGYAREAVIVYLSICAFWQALAENKNVPPVRESKRVPAWVKKLVEQPQFMQATIQYPRIFQGWGMFAPNPITDDGSLSIEAWTLDGRRVDPFTGKEPDLDLTDARGLGLGQIRQDYFNRIRLDRNKVFRQGLREYLLRWHLETGRPEDELVGFDVYWVRDQCPKPGQKQAYKNELIALLTYRRPGYKPPPGKPPLPPEPKVESAGP